MLRLSNKYKILFITFIALSNLVFIEGCKKGGEPTAPEENKPDWIQEGWQKFEVKQYAIAVTNFNNALHLNPNDSIAAIAYCGIGWCEVKLQSYDTAYNNFTFAVQRDSVSPGPYVADAYVGRAGVLQKKNLYYDAIADAKKTLILDGTYKFAHDSTIKFTDLHFLLSEAYYHTSQYLNAQGEVDYLRNLFGLNAIAWSTKDVVVDGVTFATYQEALLKAIEGLRGRV
jgi:tetratricopeptide (TPR) repeat protein